MPKPKAKATVAPAVPAAPEKPKAIKLIFQLRKRTADEHFPQLWELTMLHSNGKLKEMLTDADQIFNQFERIGNYLETEGY